jgi:hypothetical protein
VFPRDPVRRKFPRNPVLENKASEEGPSPAFPSTAVTRSVGDIKFGRVKKCLHLLERRRMVVLDVECYISDPCVFLRNRGYQLYIYLHIVYFKLEISDPQWNIGQSNALLPIQLFSSPSNGAKLHREGTTYHLTTVWSLGSCAALPEGRRASNHLFNQ